MVFDKNKQSDSHEDDPFTRIMFGPRKQNMDPIEDKNQLISFLDNVDLDQLLENIDLLMASAQQLKPLMNKVGPVVQQFLKKE